MPVLSSSRQILEVLSRLYPDAGTELVFRNPFELLIAVMLSAQCTDRQVNKITAKLFNKYRTPGDIAVLSPDELAMDIRECGLYRNKSKNIVNTCKLLLEKYHSEVPGDMNELLTLPGVGRKSASVILIVAYGMPAMPVDTHVFRLAGRLGLSRGKTPEAVEKDLLSIVPQEQLGHVHHQMIFHGRRVCTARKPRCAGCELQNFCPSRQLQDGLRSEKL
jgi:endonuclease-3